jgi:hypothetical protein
LSRRSGAKTDRRGSLDRWHHYTVMKITPFLAIIVCLSILAGNSASSQDTNKITGTIDFVNVPVDRVLDVYKHYAKSQLVIANDVRLAAHNITLHATGVSPEVVRQMIEQALLKQAGIVITRLDDGRVSVTYNDQLELEP